MAVSVQEALEKATKRRETSVQKECYEATCRQLFWTHPRRPDQRWCSNKCYQRTRRWEIKPRVWITPQGYLPHHGLSVAEEEEVLVAYYTTDEPIKQMAQRYGVQTCTIQAIARHGRPRGMIPKTCASPWCDKKFPWARQKMFCSHTCQRQVADARHELVLPLHNQRRQPALSKEDLQLARSMRRDGKSWVFIAAFLEVGRTTLRKYLSWKTRPQGPIRLRSPRVQEALRKAIQRREHYLRTGEWASG